MATAGENTRSAAKRGGRSCVAGGPGESSCKNKQFTEGVSFNTFPDRNVDLVRYLQWGTFVRRHRPK
jgi:hypothetical protein